MNYVTNSSLFSIAWGAGLECVANCNWIKACLQNKKKVSTHANIICNKILPNAGPKECKLTIQKCV